MKKLLSAACAFVLLVACSGGGSPQTQTGAATDSHAADTAVLRLGLMPTLDCLPFYYARRAGIFDSLGLDVELLTFTAQMDLDTALAGGSADGIYSDLVRSVLMAHRAQAQPTIVMATDGAWNVVVTASLRLRNASQLDERMIAVARHSASDLVSDQVAKAGGIRPDRIYRPQINNVNLRAAMLTNAQVDAAVLPEPQATQARARGHKQIYSTASEKLHLGCFTFNRQRLNSPLKAAQVRSLIKAYDLAAAQINRGGKAVCDSVLSRDFGLTAAEADTLRLPRYAPAHNPAPSDMEAAIGFLASRRLVPKGFAADSIVTTVYLK